MQNDRIYNIPIVDQNYGRITGLIDVMDIIDSLMKGKAGKLFWDFAQETAFGDDTGSVYNYNEDNRAASVYTSSRRPNREPSIVAGTVLKPRSVASGPSEIFTFKVTLGEISHRVKCPMDNYSNLHSELAKKLNLTKEQFFLTYLDNENENVKLGGDDDLIEAVNMVKQNNGNVLKLAVKRTSSSGNVNVHGQMVVSSGAEHDQDQMWALVGVSVAVGVAVALVSFLTISMFRSRSNSDEKSKKK